MPEAAGYEVEVSPVPARRRPLILPLAAALTIAVVMAAASLVTSAPRQAAPAIPVPSAAVPASAVATAPAGPVPTNCKTMRAYDCREAVDAARLAIADEPVVVAGADAWPTLICGDNFDCPPPLLAASDPVGSVALMLSDRSVVWVNVFRVARPNRLNETREVLETRVVRWFPAPA